MKLSCLLVVLILAGCATAPADTPGAGRGQTYTPIVDMQGVDPARYSADLGDCRRYAGVVDANRAAMDGAIGGAIMGAVISAMLGGNHNTNMQVGSATGFTGLTRAEGRATDKQERVIINCMTGRGYRALDAAMVLPSANVAGLATPAANMAVAALATSPYYTPQAPDAPRLTIISGQDLLQAERYAKDQSCHAAPRPVLAVKGPGFETYSVGCLNGDTIMVRCEFGNCRTLR